MTSIADGAIDCDIHPGVPNIKALLPYMDEYWQESFVARGIDGFDMASYPPNAPITCRPDWRVPRASARAPISACCSPMRWMRSAAAWRSATPLYWRPGRGQRDAWAPRSARAVNDWIIEQWLEQGSASACLHRGARRRRRSSRWRKSSDALPIGVRADPDAGGVRDDARPALLLADLSRRRRSTVCRSACTPAACIATRRRRAAGRRIICRTMSQLEHVRGPVAQPDVQRRVRKSFRICAWC